MPELRKSKIQSWFQFKGLRTMYHQPVQADDTARVFTVVDRHNNKKKATSNEFYVAAALDELGLEFEFQISVFGGRRISGGFVLDFLVMTRPNPTPVWVHGEHWHTGEQSEQDAAAIAAVEQFGQGGFNPSVVIWGSESSSQQLAYNTVRRLLF